MKRAGILLIVAAVAVVAVAAPTIFAVTPTMSYADGYALLGDPNHGRVLYVFGGKGFKAFKPYVKELTSPKGLNPLRDNIPDHIHHHGLMFAVAVDGVNFWAEYKNCGREDRGKLGVARFAEMQALTEKLRWRSPDGKVVATEHRVIGLALDKASDYTLITWLTQLAPPPGANAITLTGHHYYGLGMRFVKSMDNASTFTFADPDAKGTTVRGDEKLTPSNWAACTGKVDGKTVSVALFDHPDNPRKALWFTMSKPFSYLSATINLWKQPMTIKAGQKLDVCYGVAVWDGKATREQIEAAYEAWRPYRPSLKASEKKPANPKEPS